MLTEPQASRVNPDLDQELMDPRYKITKCFIRYDPICHRVAHSDLLRLRTTARLHISVKKVENNIAYFVEFFVFLVLGVDVMFYLRHGKFAHTKQTCTRGYFVPERTSDLRRGKWNATIVELKETGEV
jgi:hypothetical protein